MANASVNTVELMQLLDITPASHNLLLVGDKGIGKSSILTSYFESRGMKVVSLFLGSMSDVGDILGLPRIDEKTGRTIFIPPYWWSDTEPICLFLDELNLAKNEILSAIQDLTLNRTLAGRRLPEGSRVVAAVNDGDKFDGFLTDLSPALVSRFNIVNFKPTAAEWLLWAKKNGVDSRVTDFIQESSHFLFGEPDAKADTYTGLQKNPDPRAWTRVSDIIKGHENLGEVFTKAISSVVGPKTASAFLANVSSSKMVSGRDVLHHFDKVKKTLDGYQVHQLSVVSEGIFRCLETEKIAGKDKETVRKNLEAYFDWLTKSRKESAAFFANLYVNETYPNAVGFIAKECQMLTMLLVIYVKGIY